MSDNNPKKIHILLIAFYFVPVNKIAAVRPSKLCKYWLRQGHSVTILTSTYDEIMTPHDTSLASQKVREALINYCEWISQWIFTVMQGKGGSLYRSVNLLTLTMQGGKRPRKTSQGFRRFPGTCQIIKTGYFTPTKFKMLINR